MSSGLSVVLEKDHDSVGEVAGGTKVANRPRTTVSLIRNQRCCYLTTIGRVTGRPREIEIWFEVHRGTVYLLSGGRDRSDWVKNLKRQPCVSVRIDGHEFRGTARVLGVGTDEDRLARKLVAKKYLRTGSEWSRTSLPVAVDIDE